MMFVTGYLTFDCCFCEEILAGTNLKRKEGFILAPALRLKSVHHGAEVKAAGTWGEAAGHIASTIRKQGGGGCGCSDHLLLFTQCRPPPAYGMVPPITRMGIFLRDLAPVKLTISIYWSITVLMETVRLWLPFSYIPRKNDRILRQQHACFSTTASQLWGIDIPRSPSWHSLSWVWCLWTSTRMNYLGNYRTLSRCFTRRWNYQHTHLCSPILVPIHVATCPSPCL